MLLFRSLCLCRCRLMYVYLFTVMCPLSRHPLPSCDSKQLPQLQYALYISAILHKIGLGRPRAPMHGIRFLLASSGLEARLPPTLLVFSPSSTTTDYHETSPRDIVNRTRPRVSKISTARDRHPQISNFDVLPRTWQDPAMAQLVIPV